MGVCNKVQYVHPKCSLYYFRMAWCRSWVLSCQMWGPLLTFWSTREGRTRLHLHQCCHITTVSCPCYCTCILITLLHSPYPLQCAETSWFVSKEPFPLLGCLSGDGFEHMYRIYSQEASLCQRIFETMSVSVTGASRDEIMSYLSCWMHHPYCDPESTLTLESMLVDCELRKDTWAVPLTHDCLFVLLII